MVIDLDKCTGCGTCMVACMAENNVPFREDDTDKLLSVAWMRVYRLTNGKPFPNTEECYLPRPCQQCEGHHGHSPCVSVCPATATDYDMDTGIVSQIYTRCFGCRYCMATPIQRKPQHNCHPLPSLNWHGRTWGDAFVSEFLCVPSFSRGETRCFYQGNKPSTHGWIHRRPILCCHTSRF